MGIKHLNNYLVSNCNNNAIKKIGLEELRGKVIVVDASIYLYRFMSDGRLTEHIYHMLSVLSNYQIEPIFIFDGDCPPEKKDLIKERKEKKLKAEAKFEELKLQLAENDADKVEIANEMEKLKKQFIYIKSADYQIVKNLLNAMGFAWIEAPGEADELCAHFMLTGKAYACLSEDMDMFAYGCYRVLRHLSLIKHTVLFYDLCEILGQLNMNIQEFRQVVVLSGTDYNKDNNSNLIESMRLFRAYKKDMMLWEGRIPSFYEWLINKTNYVSNPNELRTTHNMFVVKYKPINYTTVKKEKNKKLLVEYLGQDGFIFM